MLIPKAATMEFSESKARTERYNIIPNESIQ